MCAIRMATNSARCIVPRRVRQPLLFWRMNKFARNSFSAEEFGLTNEQIRTAFRPYIERFGAHL